MEYRTKDISSWKLLQDTKISFLLLRTTSKTWKSRFA